MECFSLPSRKLCGRRSRSVIFHSHEKPAEVAQFNSCSHKYFRNRKQHNVWPCCVLGLWLNAPTFQISWIYIWVANYSTLIRNLFKGGTVTVLIFFLPRFGLHWPREVYCLLNARLSHKIGSQTAHCSIMLIVNPSTTYKFIIKYLFWIDARKKNTSKRSAERWTENELCSQLSLTWTFNHRCSTCWRDISHDSHECLVNINK